jgi:hypothetical protein
MKKGPSGESILLIHLKREWGGTDAMLQLWNGGGEIVSEPRTQEPRGTRHVQQTSFLWPLRV